MIRLVREERELFGGLLAVAMVALIAGCGTSRDDHSTDRRLPVFAGIPPLAYLVEQIGGQHVRVDVLVQPGQDPHTFEPTPQQIIALGGAAIFFKIDMPFETVLLEKAQEGNQRLKVVDVQSRRRRSEISQDWRCGTIRRCRRGLRHI